MQDQQKKIGSFCKYKKKATQNMTKKRRCYDKLNSSAIITLSHYYIHHSEHELIAHTKIHPLYVHLDESLKLCIALQPHTEHIK